MGKVHPEAHKQIALVTYEACGKNAEATVRALRSKQNIEVCANQVLRWVRGEFIEPETTLSGEELKKLVIERADAIALKALARVADTIETATVMQAATAFGIMVDKTQLLRGDATNIQGHVTMTDEQKQQEIERIFEKSRIRREAEGLKIA